jgi:hypothetical protein
MIIPLRAFRFFSRVCVRVWAAIDLFLFFCSSQHSAAKSNNHIIIIIPKPEVVLTV